MIIIIILYNKIISVFFVRSRRLRPQLIEAANAKSICRRIAESVLDAVSICRRTDITGNNPLTACRAGVSSEIRLREHNGRHTMMPDARPDIQTRCRAVTEGFQAAHYLRPAKRSNITGRHSCYRHCTSASPRSPAAFSCSSRAQLTPNVRIQLWLLYAP